MNGIGRRPHLEEVQTLEDVQARLEIEERPDDIIVIEGEVITHQKEEFLFLGDQTIRLEQDEVSQAAPERGSTLPAWIAALREGEADEQSEAPATTGEAEHSADVEGHAKWTADKTSGDGAGEGPDQSGAGEDRGSSADDDRGLE